MKVYIGNAKIIEHKLSIFKLKNIPGYLRVFKNNRLCKQTKMRMKCEIFSYHYYNYLLFVWHFSDNAQSLQ